MHAFLTRLFFFGCLATVAMAQGFPLGLPRLESVRPRGAQRGTEVVLTFSGQLLSGPTGVLFENAAGTVVADLVEDTASVDANSKSARKVTAKVRLPAEISPGLQSLRLLTRGGLSEPIPFSIGTLPEVDEADANEKTDTNNTPGTAQALPLGQVVNGAMNGADTDCYKVAVKRGQRVTAELECLRLATETDDGTEHEIQCHDAAGSLLASSDDTALYLTEPYFSFIAKEDADLTLTVRSVLPSINGRKSGYRLHVGSFLRPAALFPSGGTAGATEKVMATDETGASLGEHMVTWPKESRDGLASLSVEAATAHGNPVRIFAATNQLEKEPNDEKSLAASTVAAERYALNGKLEKAGDVDYWKFPVVKGQRYNVKTYAQALGSPADLVLQLEAGSGKPERSDDVNEGDLNLFEQSFLREKLDPRLVFTAKETGEAVLQVRDTRGEGSALHFYRLEIEPSMDGLLLGFTAPDGNVRLHRSAAVVAQGSRAVYWLAVKQLFGSDKVEGEFDLHVSGLPTGVKATVPKFKADQRKIPILLEAAADAPLAASYAQFSVGDGSVPCVFHHMVGQTFTNNEVNTARLFSGLAVGVAAAPPFELTVQQPEAPLSKNSEILLDVAIKRQPGYEREVEVLLENPPPGIQAVAGFKFGKKESAGTLRVAADGNATAGKFPLRFTARNKTEDNGRNGRTYVASNPVTLEVADAYLKVQAPRTSLEQGKKEVVTLKLTKLRDWPVAARLNLLRLPKGVTLEAPVALANDAATVNVTLVTAPDSLVGTYSGIGIEGVFEVEGKELKQSLGSATLRVDPARK
jgi:hypothetical protein